MNIRKVYLAEVFIEGENDDGSDFADEGIKIESEKNAKSLMVKILYRFKELVLSIIDTESNCYLLLKDNDSYVPILIHDESELRKSLDQTDFHCITDIDFPKLNIAFIVKDREFLWDEKFLELSGMFTEVSFVRIYGNHKNYDDSIVCQAYEQGELESGIEVEPDNEGFLQTGDFETELFSIEFYNK